MSEAELLCGAESKCLFCGSIVKPFLCMAKLEKGFMSQFLRWRRPFKYGKY